MTKLTATHEGQTFKRTTDRTYTHVIIVKDQGEAWKAKSWAGSFDLALKRISEFSRAGREVKIIPVNSQRPGYPAIIFFVILCNTIKI